MTVFDPDKIDDLASKRMPAKLDEEEIHRHPPGIAAVVVNGKVVLEHGECRDVFPGQVRRQDLFVQGQLAAERAGSGGQEVAWRSLSRKR